MSEAKVRAQYDWIAAISDQHWNTVAIPCHTKAAFTDPFSWLVVETFRWNVSTLIVGVTTKGV
ncbi:MAG TPA: hypothetical protein V6D48_21670 [Oculatellaceae cyanobacterium]